VIASRYVKAQDWENATSILHSGAQSLLQAGQGGSGGDLCIFLIDVFNKGEVKPDASSKGKLLGLLRAFPKDEPTKKKVVGEMIAWSSNFGEYPAGDPEIHHVAGSLYADGMFTSSDVWLCILIDIQILNHTRQSVICSSATKTRPLRSPPSSIRGTKPMIRTPHPCTAHVAYYHTSSLATYAPPTNSSFSLHRFSPRNPASTRNKYQPPPPTCAYTRPCRY
jgi:hypothetical protein